MREQIESALRPLIGLALWRTRRVVNMQLFSLGAQHPKISRSGKPILVGDYGLHLQCSWRIVGVSGIEVGSMDMYYPPGDPFEVPPDFEWDEGPNRRDQHMDRLFAGRQENPFYIEAVTADDAGGFVLHLTEGFTLEAIPNDTLPRERWRLLNIIDKEQPHFVVTGRGIEDQTDEEDTTEIKESATNDPVNIAAELGNSFASLLE